jgi:hypothetical protein
MAEQNGEQNPNGQQPGGQSGGQQQQPQQNPTGGGQQQPQQQQPGSGAGAEKTFSYKEDRTDWVPRHRLNELTGGKTKAEQERDTARAELDTERKRVLALSGVTPQDPKAQEASQIRDAILELVPEIGLLKGLTKEQLNEILDAAQTARTSSQATWERHATTMLNDLDSEAGKILGTDKLTPTQQGRIRRAYRDEAMQAMETRQEQMERGERRSLDTTAQDNDFVARHERGDKTLIKEFTKAFLDDFYEPARRQVTAQQARRQFRPTPRGERERTPLTQGAQKVNLNDEAEFKKALLAARGSGQE